eukprot:CAMPEP_0198369906 /NCGR_PEP_ID=MMETSP1450-20131203/156444_1 /TAXON_ID=753684 ORGANISM="Madagascaria erythrocladiodes, Strain CCMP3234" /NCGR_SAMPLE_ID=MMETSP1450 /ASSEMBLY_ACC=CAM_ASM_001115 /LENGTH=132 /DNA_ID=CAMNT_0044077433 /DNA_START=60 /DNA_END=458 /DNA_ORIENTATION=-
MRERNPIIKSPRRRPEGLVLTHPDAERTSTAPSLFLEDKTSGSVSFHDDAPTKQEVSSPTSPRFAKTEGGSFKGLSSNFNESDGRHGAAKHLEETSKRKLRMKPKIPSHGSSSPHGRGSTPKSPGLPKLFGQ